MTQFLALTKTEIGQLQLSDQNHSFFVFLLCSIFYATYARNSVYRKYQPKVKAKYGGHKQDQADLWPLFTKFIQGK